MRAVSKDDIQTAIQQWKRERDRLREIDHIYKHFAHAMVRDLESAWRAIRRRERAA